MKKLVIKIAAGVACLGLVVGGCVFNANVGNTVNTVLYSAWGGDGWSC